MPYMEIGNPSITKAPAENQAMRCGSVLSVFVCIEVCFKGNVSDE
jgi:hypothetical protein